MTPSRVVAPAAAASDVAVSRPGLSFLLFCALTFVLVGRPQDFVPLLVPLRPALTLTLLTAILTIVQRPPGIARLFQQAESRVFLLFFFIMVAEIPFAQHRGFTFMVITERYLSNVIYFLLFVTHVDTFEKYRRVLVMFVSSMALFSVAGLALGDSRFGRFEFTDINMFDANDIAFVELALLPFALSVLLGRRFGVLIKAMAACAVVAGVLLALYTGSRGGFLGFIGFCVLFFLLRMGPVKKGHKALILVVVAGAIALNASKINFERYVGITDLSEDYNLSNQFGRKAIWQQGLEIFFQNPLTGVGAGNFGRALGYLRLDMNLVPRFQEPHNSYVQVLAETGIFGFSAFVWLIFSSIRTLNRLRRQTDSSGTARDLSLVGATQLAGSAGLLVAAFFLTQGYSPFLTIFFANPAALKNIAERELSEGALAAKASNS